MSKHELAIADRWFERRGEVIVLIARLLPVIPHLHRLSGGGRADEPHEVPRLYVRRVVPVVPWPGLCGQYLGVQLLDEHSPLKQVMHKLDLVIGLTIVVVAVVFIRSRLKALKGYRDAEAAEAAAAKE